MNHFSPVSHPIIVGKISGVYGVHGWVKVFSHTEPRNNILQYDPWLIKDNDKWLSATLLKGRKQGKTIVAQLKGIDDRDKAHALIGSEIAINESQLMELGDDEFYWRDLQGLSVVNQNGTKFGVVAYMMATGANDVMVVRLETNLAKKNEGKELLIPYLMDKVIKRVSLTERLIEVDWDEDFD